MLSLLTQISCTSFERNVRKLTEYNVPSPKRLPSNVSLIVQKSGMVHETSKYSTGWCNGNDAKRHTVPAALPYQLNWAATEVRSGIYRLIYYYPFGKLSSWALDLNVKTLDWKVEKMVHRMVTLHIKMHVRTQHSKG